MTQTLKISLASIALVLMTGAGVSLAFAAGDDDAPLVGKATFSESQALTIAKDAYAGDGSFTDIELEMEGSTLVYAVEFTEKDGNEVDVKLDAKTGTVVIIESDKTEADDDDDGDDEDGGRVASMETLIRLLNQLLDLLRA